MQATYILHTFLIQWYVYLPKMYKCVNDNKIQRLILNVFIAKKKLFQMVITYV